MTTTDSQVNQSTSPATLTIGALADRTGLSPATLRMWESRHGFPQPVRLDSGHRRYNEADVAAVDHVVRRRNTGVRLEAAIAEAIDDARPTTPSVFAELRKRHPHLVVHRLRKSTLIALSWAIEDEFCARAQQARLFGGFQHAHHYEASRPRWRELAKIARSTIVFADFDSPPPGPLESAPHEPTLVALPPQAPMCREWTVICDSVELPIALAAWELPGQDDELDRERIFEALWTVEPRAVRDAARVCARVAQEHGMADATPMLYDLAEDPGPGVTDLAAVTTLFNRVVSYVDRVAG